jgi:hypothetical protein
LELQVTWNSGNNSVFSTITSAGGGGGSIWIPQVQVLDLTAQVVVLVEVSGGTSTPGRWSRKYTSNKSTSRKSRRQSGPW